MMERWRYVVVWADYAVFWRGISSIPGIHTYPLTVARRRRLEAVLGDAITPATEGQSWLWSWNDWNWHNIGGR